MSTISAAEEQVMKQTQIAFSGKAAPSYTPMFTARKGAYPPSYEYRWFDSDYVHIIMIGQRIIKDRLERSLLISEREYILASEFFPRALNTLHRT